MLPSLSLPHPRTRRHWPWLLPGLLLAATIAHAEDAVYTWTDAGGRVHYSNRPPANQPATTVPLNSGTVSVRPTEQIYTWTDAEGHVHYGTRPPAGVSAKALSAEDAPLSTIHAGQLRSGEQRLLRDIQNHE